MEEASNNYFQKDDSEELPLRNPDGKTLMT